MSNVWDLLFGSQVGVNTVLAAPSASSGALSPRLLVASDIPNLDASKITTGTLALARGGTNADLSGTGGSSQVLKQTSVGGAVTVAQLAFSDISGTIASAQFGAQTSGKALIGPISGGAANPTFRLLDVADIPNLPAPIITSGTIALARGGTNSDLSGTGGTSQVLRQSSVGAVVTVSQLAYSDISGTPASGTVLWNALGNASGALTLANAGNATTFNQTSAVNWTWANTTAATAGGTVASSPLHVFTGHVFSSGVDTAPTWSVQSLAGAALTFTITNAAETAGNVVTLTIGAHTLIAGNVITMSGITGTFSYLNTLNARITSVTGTTIVFTDPSGHGVQGSAASNGTVTQIANLNLTFSAAGSAGDQRIIFPAGTAASAGSLAFSGQPDQTGFGLASSTVGGLAAYMASGSSNDVLQIFTPTSGVQTQKARISIGDNSGANQVLTFSTFNFVNNYAVQLISSITTGTVATANPGVMIGNGSNFTAVSGQQVGLALGVTSSGTNRWNFAPTSGTATFQPVNLRYTVNQTGGANGTVTGLLLQATETAVVGTHLLLDFQAGTAGTTSVFTMNNSGIVTRANALSTVGMGFPILLATNTLTAQSAAQGSTNIQTAGATGLYRVSWSADITTAASTSSVLGGTNGFQIQATSPTDSVSKTYPRTITTGVNTDSSNTTATGLSGVITFPAKTGTTINFTFDYTSVGGTAMVYELRYILERLT